MARRIIELKEWEALDVPLEDGDVAAMVGHPQRPVLVEASPVRGCWRLRAQAKVGAIRFDGFDLIIRPKAGLQNVFYLMGVERPRDWWGRDEVDLLIHDDLFAGIARLLASAVERAIGRGVQHGYVERRDALVALRGRVDLKEQFRRPATPVPVNCRYDDYTPDTRLNQLIRAALVRVLRLPGVPGSVRRTLHLQVSLLRSQQWSRTCAGPRGGSQPGLTAATCQPSVLAPSCCVASPCPRQQAAPTPARSS